MGKHDIRDGPIELAYAPTDPENVSGRKRLFYISSSANALVAVIMLANLLIDIARPPDSPLFGSGSFAYEAIAFEITLVPMIVIFPLIKAKNKKRLRSWAAAYFYLAVIAGASLLLLMFAVFIMF